MSARSLWQKFRDSRRNDSISTTVSKIIRYPSYRARLNPFLKPKTIEERFTKIFEMNYWSHPESVSGVGSSLIFTENLRTMLPDLMQKFEIKSIFDAPCGDFNWMKLVVDDDPVTYMGGDIVKSLISNNDMKYSGPRVSFIHTDITSDDFPKADMWLCRECLIHLSYEDTFKALRKFVDSGIPYVLTTTYDNPTGNFDIETGDFRLIDLFSQPYNFAAEPLYRIDDYIKCMPQREMCLWSRDMVASSLSIRTQQ
jgi:hypothetical protein